jgi:TRAP-type C4-dicarboxylate transport system substrate-binding protein
MEEKVMKKQLLWIPLIVIMSVGLILSGYSKSEAEAPTKLVFSNWLPPPPINPVSKGFEEWARDFETRTGGRYKVDVVHGGVLAGIPQSYDVVVSGVADISDIITQDVEKPFPLSDIPGLPFVHLPAEVYAKAWFNNVYKKGYLDKEFSDLKILIQFVAMGEDFLTVKPINSIADMKGLKVVTGGGPTKAKLTKSLGAVGVFGGPPDAYMMLQKGIAEAIFIAALGLKEFHWDEFIKYIIEPLCVGSVIHTVAMNKNTYNKLPDDVKAIIEDMNANGQYSLKLASAFQNIYQHVRQSWLKEGGKSIKWNKGEIAKLNQAVAPLWKEWIATQEARGVPARKVIDEYYNGLKALGVKNPAIGYTPGS